MEKIYLAGCKGGIQKMTGWAIVNKDLDVVLSMEKIDEQSNRKECEQKKQI